MHEACYCGWTGALDEREVRRLDGGEWGLACPRCGSIDRLEWLPAARRVALITEARRPQAIRSLASEPAA